MRGVTDAEGMSCQLKLEENGEFTFVQFGGASTAVPAIINGTFKFDMTSYSYTELNGNLVLAVDSVENESIETILSKDSENQFFVYWKLDSNTGIAYIDLESKNLNICNNIYNGREINSREFDSNMPETSSDNNENPEENEK